MRGNSGYGFLVNKTIKVSGNFLLFTALALGLSACAVYENKFDCPPGKGAHCSSVEEIEQMVNNGVVWKVNGKVKVAKQKKRLRENCSGGSCDDFYEFDDGIRIESNPQGKTGNINYIVRKSS
ncbi:MAG: hypothetical protein FJX70_05110 [Alphaproteobacteria bacterium]|nr:hypothetical protein [Alphaproteobacteria bacterium]